VKKKIISTPPPKVPILDIPGHCSFQYLYGNDPEFSMNGTRVTAFFIADEKFYELAARFNNNEPVNVLDFLNAQRQLKARMFSMKAGR
jgi:hypothetical protein